MRVLSISWMVVEDNYRGKDCRKLIIRYRFFWMREYDRVRSIKFF
jgi:hypothetical protein